MARSAWLRMMSAGFFGGSLGLLVLGGCFNNVGAQQGTCVDDTNPCTVDTCDANNVPIHTPVPNADKVQCFLGENEGLCVDGGCELTCKTQMTPCKCNAKTDCPTDNFCATWECTMGECVSTAMMEGMTADPLMPGDCQKKICQGGSLKIVDDPMDTATDAKGDCQDPVCNAGVPGTMANDNDVPMTDDMPGDCNKPACNGGVLGTMPDTNDIPPAVDCTTYSCNPDGTQAGANSKIGTPCGPNKTSVCDKGGMCATCLEKADWDQCNKPAGSCIVPKCEGQPCTTKSECKDECTDGVCCDTTCTEECKSCNVVGSVGKCTNVPKFVEDDNYGAGLACTAAVSGSFCDGAGKCFRSFNTPCMNDAQCFSNKCVSMKCLGGPGETCNGNTQCASMMCAMGACK